jgi:hypothetical protein
MNINYVSLFVFACLSICQVRAQTAACPIFQTYNRHKTGWILENAKMFNFIYLVYSFTKKISINRRPVQIAFNCTKKCNLKISLMYRIKIYADYFCYSKIITLKFILTWCKKAIISVYNSQWQEVANFTSNSGPFTVVNAEFIYIEIVRQRKYCRDIYVDDYKYSFE